MTKDHIHMNGRDAVTIMETDVFRITSTRACRRGLAGGA
jgi:hypothetical protein